MSLAEIIMLAIAMAIDALIVSFSYGLILKTNRLKNALAMSLSFGFFQFMMPVLGWHFAGVVYTYIERYSKWIVFCVFLVLGLKFLKEAFSKSEEQQITNVSALSIICLAVATSIDAFGAGVSIRLLNTPVFFPSSVIGFVTFLLSISGFYAAGIFSKLESKYVEIIGACILIYLAVKALL